MLRPSKHAHPDKTIINCAVMILDRLKKRRIDGFEELRVHVQKSLIGGAALFLPALNLLYLLGLLEYRAKNDTIEYTGKNETV